jgi:CCR4-NOT transcription complex subunit 1
VNQSLVNSQETQILCKELDAAVLQLPYQTLIQLPSNHEIRPLLRQIIILAAESADHRQNPLHMSQKIVQLMYKATSQLGREIYVAILDQLCHAFEEVAKEAISWLIYSDDEVTSSQIQSLNVIDWPLA